MHGNLAQAAPKEPGCGLTHSNERDWSVLSNEVLFMDDQREESNKKVAQSVLQYSATMRDRAVVK
jgi:hypothetical protein